MKQELGKEGVLPWSRIWASDKPFGTPGASLFLHWAFSIVVISATKSGDAYNFVVLLFTYSQTAVAREYFSFNSRELHLLTYGFLSLSFHWCWPSLPSVFSFATPYLAGRAHRVPLLVAFYCRTRDRKHIPSHSAFHTEQERRLWSDTHRKDPVLVLPDRGMWCYGARRDILGWICQDMADFRGVS